MAGLCHAQLKRWYASYNHRFFGDRLPADMDVLYAPMDRCLALAEHHDNDERVITIDTKVAGTTHAKADLFHEMNHHDTEDWTHGAKFQAGMMRLAKAGAFRHIW